MPDIEAIWHEKQEHGDTSQERSSIHNKKLRGSDESFIWRV